jgi:hypothetical protein
MEMQHFWQYVQHFDFPTLEKTFVAVVQPSVSHQQKGMKDEEE